MTAAKEKTVPAVKQETHQEPVPAKGAAPTREETRYLVPPVDIYETADGLTVVVDLPGVDRNGVEVRVDQGVLTIEGKTTRTDLGDRFYTEYALLDYFRQFELSDTFDQDKISAELNQGVLTIHLPKVEAAKPKTIPVKVV